MQFTHLFNLLKRWAFISVMMTLPVTGYCYIVQGTITNLMPEPMELDSTYGQVTKAPNFLKRNEKGDFLLQEAQRVSDK